VGPRPKNWESSRVVCRLGDNANAFQGRGSGSGRMRKRHRRKSKNGDEIHSRDARTRSTEWPIPTRKFLRVKILTKSQLRRTNTRHAMNKTFTKSRSRISRSTLQGFQTAPRKLLSRDRPGKLRPKRVRSTPACFAKWTHGWRAANYLSIGQTYLYDNPPA